MAGEKWTGTAAVVFDQTAALVRAGLEGQFGFVRASPLAERLRNLGWARPLLAHPRGAWDYARDARRLKETLLREKFDVVHAHATHDHYLAAFAVSGTPARLVRTFHNLRHVRRDGFSRALFVRTRAFAFSNASIAAAFGASGPIHSPVVDTERFRPGPADDEMLTSFGIGRRGRLIGTVGKMSRGRGHEDTIAAVALLDPSVALVHVGHGERMPQLKRRAQELGAGDRNFWVGYQEDTLPSLYRSWDAYLFAASGSDQGQRAILEAMASGTPVVAIDLPGVRDLMTDGEEGHIVRRPEELPDALRRLFESEDRRREMAEKARRRALDFTGARFAEKAVGFYEQVVGRRR